MIRKLAPALLVSDIYTEFLLLWKLAAPCSSLIWNQESARQSPILKTIEGCRRIGPSYARARQELLGSRAATWLQPACIFFSNRASRPASLLPFVLPSWLPYFLSSHAEHLRA